MINDLTYILIIVILSATASVFFYANPAREKTQFTISLSYFSAFFGLSAIAFSSFTLPNNSLKLAAIFTTNFVFVSAFLCLMRGFKQRNNPEHELLFKTKEFWFTALSPALINSILYLASPSETYIRATVLLVVLMVIVLLTIPYISNDSKQESYGEKTSKITLNITVATITGLILVLVITRNEDLYFSLLTIAYSSILVLLMGSIQTMFMSDFADLYKKESNTDFLTGLHNRRYFINSVQEFLKLSKRNDKSASLLMIDIDDFKFINDIFGHDIGDSVLQNIADVIANTIRDSDICARIGGEEFSVFMPDCDQEGACLLAERIKEKATALTTQSHICDVKVSLSIGVCEITPKDTLTETMKHADRALYFAKENGKNQVCNYDRIKSMDKPVTL
ncbi:MAG: GGDEF domain-containing protein [Gammaproteobacteria bacterium]|nr:GGDEF domain-containing protein [Gammaproteobacteria bacterium]